MTATDALDTPMPDASASPGLAKHAKQLAAVPFSEKYRPASLSDVSSHTDIISTITKLLEHDQLPHLLFYGPPGTGKTSTILAMAKHIYGPKILDAMTLELNASDDRGISIVRNEIQEFASTRTMVSNKFKLIILDECDAMTKDAQMALRRVMERYVKNARFCLICNYVSKIIPALQSRCTRFRFMPLPMEFVKQRIEYVCENENIEYKGPVQQEGVNSVIKLGSGDMRRTLNLLQSVAMGHEGALTEKNVYATAGKPMPADVEEIVQSLLNDDLRQAYERIKGLMVKKGIALVDVLYELHELVFRVGMGSSGRIELVQVMSEVEWNLLSGSSREDLQLGALVGGFVRAREHMVKEAV
jgi:replication factor C subunit 3/5